MQSLGSYEAMMYGNVGRACIYVLYDIDTPRHG